MCIDGGKQIIARSAVFVSTPLLLAVVSLTVVTTARLGFIDFQLEPNLCAGRVVCRWGFFFGGAAGSGTHCRVDARPNAKCERNEGEKKTNHETRSISYSHYYHHHQQWVGGLKERDGRGRVLRNQCGKEWLLVVVHAR